MATHCDTMDGPLMKAARRALESGNVNLVLLGFERGRCHGEEGERGHAE